MLQLKAILGFVLSLALYAQVSVSLPTAVVDGGSLVRAAAQRIEREVQGNDERPVLMRGVEDGQRREALASALDPEMPEKNAQDEQRENAPPRDRHDRRDGPQDKPNPQPSGKNPRHA